MFRAGLSALTLLAAASAAAQPFPARTGESGILGVPDAEVVGLGRGQLAAELRLDRVAGEPTDVGPLPLYVVAGATGWLDVGLTAREWGRPGDPRPAQMLYGAAAKLQLFEPAAVLPGMALSLGFDRFNERPIWSARLAASNRRLGPVRAAAFVGTESEPGAFGGLGLTAGAAVSLALPWSLELVGEATESPRGPDFGAALRWQATPTGKAGQAGRTWGLAVGANRLPDEDAWRVAVTLAFAPSDLAPKPVAAARAPKAKEEAPEPEGPELALGDRPAFRLRIASGGPESAYGPRHRQHGVPERVVEELPAARGAVTQAAAAGPTAEDVFESQLRDQEAAADARERRLKSTEDSLAQRLAAASTDSSRLEDRDLQLSARELQLDAREQRIVMRGPPTQPERAIEAQEAQLRAQERQLAAQERGFQPAIDAASGRERDAAAREQVERAETARLAEAWSRARERVAQLDTRRQALSARQRQLAATETRLLAMGERVDALERQVRARAERLDAWQRRLDARAQRLELIEPRAGEPRKAAEPTEAAPREKAVFVMVVKTPTAIMKEGGGTPAPAGPIAAPSGAAVEKGVAAATVVSFPTPQSELSELDREAIENLARLAAREGTELLVWARAKSPALLPEAQRRADAIKKLCTAAAKLEPRRVVTRVTTRPGAVGVDVVVSALRDPGAKPSTPAAPGQLPIQMLAAGETGKRQIRDAVLRAQPSIEGCVGDHLQRGKLTRAEGVLKLTVAANGKVVIVKASEGDLASAELEGCLTAAARGWQFPASEGEYVVDVPITVVGGGAR